MDNVIDHFSFQNAELTKRINEIMDRVASVDPEQQMYEKTIREGLITCESPLTSDEFEELFQKLCGYFLTTKDVDSQKVLPYFYACFDWLNRRETSAEIRGQKLDELFRLASDAFENYSLYHYAKSSYLRITHSALDALDEAQLACSMSQSNPGWLNNYAELLLQVIEDSTLAGNPIMNEHTSPENIKDVLARFGQIASSNIEVYPSFYQTRGRLAAISGNMETARTNFEESRRLLSTMRQNGNERFANEDDYLRELSNIIRAQTTSELIQSMATATQSMDALEKRQQEAAEKFDEHITEISDRMENDRVNMLEFLGFFSGIISFIIASLTIGDDMAFVARAALIIVLLGTLLIAFGALGAMLEGMRPSKHGESGVRVGTVKYLPVAGVVAIAAAFILYFAMGA